MRLDVFLAKKGWIESRSKAKELILRGEIEVNGAKVYKPSFEVSEIDKIDIKNTLKYVSRAGFKLQKAIEEFDIKVKGKVCLDVGSSTGGFTQCLLKYGAETVVAVDVGSNQMHHSLRNDDRVVLYENTDIRNFCTDIRFDIASVDVSFISVSLILEDVKRLLRSGADAIVLIKPQFEVGPGKVKRGIVKDEKEIQRVVSNIRFFAREIGFRCLGLIESPIKGKEGNREFLMWLKNG